MQKQSESYQDLVNALKSASKLLNLERNSQLVQDINTISHYLTNPNFQIAVFGPFNHGKSTLLNAILGNRTLPIDLIPTTGAAITVKYGSDLRTRIMLRDGTEIYRSGTEILQQYAILDGNRQMRQDVASVEVFCPHPFLARGIELLDLPGTNDREAQDILVRDRLLSTDLVVQLLDARKLMTLGERENLRDWLLDRGIKTVIFVANFINLLEPEEQQQVQNRLLFVAESFRAELPPGFSNLYRVDALPALRARLKGDAAGATSSGLATFEAALQNIVTILQQNRGDVRLPRVQAIASQIQLNLQAKIDPLLKEVKSFDEKENAKIEVKQKAANLIQQGLNKSFTELRNWLELTNLLKKYQTEATVAIAEDKFKTWQIGTLKKDLSELQLNIMKWLYQAYEFFKEERPEDLSIPLPSEPQITLPPKPGSNNDLTEPAGAVAVGGGIGWLLGGPVGAAVVGSISYLLNKNIQETDDKSAQESYHQQVAKICIGVTEDYFTELSNQGLAILGEFEYKAKRVTRFSGSPEPLEIAHKRQDLQQLQISFNQLVQQLSKAKVPTNYQPYRETPKYIPYTPPVEKEQTTYSQKEKANNSTSSTYRYSYKTAETNQANSNQRVNTSPPPKASTSPNPAEVDTNFRNWEIDQEIARMKAEMRSPGYQANKQQQKTSQSNKAPQQPKTQAEKDKITRAYSILGLQPGVSINEVKQAYKSLVKKWHPDLFVNQPQLQKQAQEKMRLINEAYTILSD
ncbi:MULTISPECIES: dynamin family protein [Calothrix]|uniref:Dynamin family protein n=2 Tax=Calothrix TaxID=1186 RepID=A0ABR8A3V2_9CYAN|nr:MULTISPECIES: dynamin family protein [Calothrix]MBD2194637.1 dynamin family protein [Calothrix parietina FACHB-288]MBD2223257.1 dynamin family protein [Calothrix anomala FACHB-343]